MLEIYCKLFSLYGVPIALNKKQSKATKCYWIIIILFQLFDAILALYAFLCIAQNFYLYYVKMETRLNTFLYFVSVTLDHLVFFSFFVLRKWLTFKKCYEIIPALNELQNRKLLNRSPSKTELFFMTFFIAFQIIFIILFQPILVEIYHNDSPVSFAIICFDFAQKSYRGLFPVLSCCFLVAICNRLIFELDEMGKQIKSANSPYRLAKLIDKQILLKYATVQKVANAANNMFSLIIVICCHAGIYDVGSIIIDLVKLDFLIVLYKLGVSFTAFSFFFCFITLRIMQQVIVKRDRIFQLLIEKLATERVVSIELFKRRLDYLKWINYRTVFDGDWFSIYGLNFNEEFCLTLLLNLLGAMEMYYLYLKSIGMW
ncbi:hypothetical protein CHUAL_006978 [Chamberlinius hualienensis]